MDHLSWQGLVKSQDCDTCLTDLCQEIEENKAKYFKASIVYGSCVGHNTAPVTTHISQGHSSTYSSSLDFFCCHDNDSTILLKNHCPEIFNCTWKATLSSHISLGAFFRVTGLWDGISQIINPTTRKS